MKVSKIMASLEGQRSMEERLCQVRALGKKSRVQINMGPRKHLKDFALS